MILIMILIVLMISIVQSENSRKTRDVSYEELLLCSNLENLRWLHLRLQNCLREVAIAFSSQVNLVDQVEFGNCTNASRLSVG